MNILVKYHNSNCQIESYGNWVDLKSSINVKLKTFENKLIPLGVSMKLPKYFQGNIVPRSSTYKKYRIIQANHYGVVDGPDSKSCGYSGNDDIWMFNAIALKDTEIKIGDRICQFEIRPIMTAPWWIKLKWIFNSKINFIEVNDLKSNNRGGFGSSDEKNIAIISKSIKDFNFHIKNNYNNYKKINNLHYKINNLNYYCISRPEHSHSLTIDDVITTNLSTENKLYDLIIDNIIPSLKNLSLEKYNEIIKKIEL